MNRTVSCIAKFRLGHLVSTPKALAILTQDDILTAIYRHSAGDWGEVDDHDRCQNESALEKGGRLFSVYRSIRGVTFWIITEADRSSSTVLLPADY
jgi:hypothetical protein